MASTLRKIAGFASPPRMPDSRVRRTQPDGSRYAPPNASAKDAHMTTRCRLGAVPASAKGAGEHRAALFGYWDVVSQREHAARDHAEPIFRSGRAAPRPRLRHKSAVATKSFLSNRSHVTHRTEIFYGRMGERGFRPPADDSMPQTRAARRALRC
jgi:hypothetical protein